MDEFPYDEDEPEFEQQVEAEVKFRELLRKHILNAPLIGKCMRFPSMNCDDLTDEETAHEGQRCFVVGLSLHQLRDADPVYVVEFEDEWLCNVSGSLLQPLDGGVI